MFDLNLHLYPFCMFASSEGSDKTVRMRRLVWAIAARGCDKYQNHMYSVPVRNPFVDKHLL